MAFFYTKVEKQGDGERDRWLVKLQVERRRRKWAHEPSCSSAWEILPKINDAWQRIADLLTSKLLLDDPDGVVVDQS